ncbi:hypothetical protein QYE76_041091 [Lolium multiflorum]|uniref:Uncharacterized protein n=1 Tax=Lolium multiflorum TaxID=4521 RepID=A0AAD8TEM0_LOLMU|nr:hypothetical protein QYE76_041091 [Lolium multiflorum]
MERIVHVHHVDKDAYLKGNIEPDPEEVDLVFDLSPSFAEVVAQVRVELNWNEPNDGVELEGRHNVGFGMHTRWKTMRINSEQRWSVYKEMVAGSQDKALELFATKTVDARIELDLNRPSSPVRERSPPPMSQEEATQSPIVQSPIAQQPPLDNEYDEHDDGDDGFEMNGNNIGDLDKYWTQEEMDHSIPYSRCYASDSDDDGPEEEVDEDGLTAKEAERAEIFKKVTGRDIRVPLFRDVSLADGAVVDGGKSLLLGARPISKRDVDATTAMISKGLTFDTFLELKIWLKEFSIKHHRPYIVVHSDLKKRYTLKCVDKRCPWVVRARPFKKGPSWHITSCVATHMCRGPKLDGKDAQPDHRQLTSKFIAYKLSAEISSLPIMSIKSVQDTVKSRFAYDVKYGKAWKAKQAAFKMLYGDWEEAYNRVPRLLLAMAATNPGMVHVVEPSATKMTLHDGKRVRVFHRAFWSFEQCTRAFEHCRPVIAVDGTFLTGQYKGTLLVAIANDVSNRLVPLAFALVEIENNDNWEWFFHILRTRVIPPSKEVCVISDRHQGILNAVELAIPGHAPLHHRWCMRHFCANFYRACKSKEFSDLLQDCCLAYSERRFANLYNGLLKHKDLNAGGQEFLHRHLIFNSKWARAYDEDGRRYGQMTSNMAECFNNVLKGVRALPVTAIIQYTFEKLNVYFQNYTDETEKEIANNCEFPTKVQEFMDFQARKADSQTATCYDNVDWVYQVNEPGGTTQGGVQHGGRAFRVSLKTCECTCMATQPTKGKGAWEGNDKEESVWEEAVRTVRKREKEALERKRREEIAKKKEEDDRMQRGYEEYLLRNKRRNDKLKAERDREARAKFLRSCQLEQIARERANRMHLEEVAREAERIKEERAQMEDAKTEERHHFFDSVVQLARDIREKEELAEESKKKKARGREPLPRSDVPLAMFLLSNLLCFEPFMLSNHDVVEP